MSRGRTAWTFLAFAASACLAGLFPASAAAEVMPRFALAVVVVKSTTQPARPDPVVYISGGPGAPLAIYAGFQARHPYAPDRDLVLVDQRDMNRSEPRLCPGLQRSLVAAMLAALLQGAARGGNEGAFVAVECRDRPRWREPAMPDANPLDLGLLPPGVCASWSAPGPAPEVPHDTAVPTLVLAGQFDPNITPAQSRGVADWIGPKARWVLFAGVGHSVRHFSTCAQTLVAAFIAQPDQPADAACAGGGKLSDHAQP